MTVPTFMFHLAASSLFASDYTLYLMTIFGDFVRMVYTNLAAYEYHGLSFEGIIDCSRFSSTPAVSYYDDYYDLVSNGLYSNLPLPG